MTERLKCLDLWKNLRGFADRARNIVAVLFLGIYFVSPHMDITATVENSATTAPASHE
jgi:hypothetical protein